MSRPLSYIGVLTFLSILLLGCKEKNVLNKGIYEIIESDSGKIQTQRMHPVAKRLKELDVPGVSIAVIDDYRIHDLITFGNRDSLNFVNSNTIFQAASVSKYVTAIIVHQFISQGLLDLDTDVNQYLKSWKVPKNDFTQDTPVTLRLLLSHQSGLPSTNFDFDKNQGVPTLVQILNADSPAINEPAIPNAIPGSRWSYSNIGYALIQQILEDITDKSFQEIAKETLFIPLQLNSSTFQYPLPPNFENNEAKPHDKFGKEQPSQLELPAKAQGGLMTTPADLAKLTTEIMKGYENNSKTFSKKTVQRLLQNELELPFRFYNQKAFMGLGVLLIDENENLAFIHNGYNSPGSVCIVMGFPSIGKGAVISANSANGEKLYLEILATLANKFDWPNGQFFKH